MTSTLNWSWDLMFNVKLKLSLDVNVKLGLTNLQFNFHGPLESILGFNADVELGPINCGLTWKSFWV